MALKEHTYLQDRKAEFVWKMENLDRGSRGGNMHRCMKRQASLQEPGRSVVAGLQAALGTMVELGAGRGQMPWVGNKQRTQD